MVFWNTYPWWKPTTPFERSALSSPTTVPYEYHPTPLPPLLRHEIRTFLRTHFGRAPHHPLLTLPEEAFLTPDDDWFLARTPDHNLVGCIRYHAIGTQWNETTPRYLVDAFCIHPAWRGKGVGDYLLTALHREANRQQKPCALFLKEGRMLPIPCLPVYQGRYAYRRLQTVGMEDLKTSVMRLTSSQAYTWLNAYLTCFPQTCVLLRRTDTHRWWRGNRKGTQSILACIQESYQRIPGQAKEEKEERIGWITLWLESPTVTDAFREEASLALSESVSESFEWIWSQRSWTGPSPHWKDDGVFYWYSYQWSLTVTPSYGIVL